MEDVQMRSVYIPLADKEKKNIMRKPCTKDNPSDGTPYEWYHPDAILVNTFYDNSVFHDDYETYECPHCGIRFKETLPN